MFTKNELKLRYKRSLELIKDYDISIIYHPGKSNVIDYSLSMLSIGSITHVDKENRVK